MPLPVVDIPHSTPWETVFRLAQLTDDPHTWMLTGGLMTQLHALMHHVAIRPTTDADFLINVLSYEHSVMRVRNDLITLGFAIRQGSLSQYSTRMVKGNQTVDLLVDNLYHRAKGDTWRPCNSAAAPPPDTNACPAATRRGTGRVATPAGSQR